MEKGRTTFIFGILIIIVASVLCFHFYFIRDPEIIIPGDEKDVLSPASGKIIKIMEINSSSLRDIEIKKGLIGKINTEIGDICNECYLISIFMSPLDIHIQRASLSGKILSIEHKFGTLLPTTKFENGLINEKTETIIYNSLIGKIKIIQIAGFVVRRIETFAEVNSIVERGERIGLIRYGSQVSIILPKEKVEITVDENEKVESGSTIIARVK